MSEIYAVIAYILSKHVTVLVEANSEVEARWKGLLVITQHGYSTSSVTNPLVYKIDINNLTFNPSKRLETA